MKQKCCECDFYFKRKDNSIRRQSNKVGSIKGKVTDIEKDSKGRVTITLKSVN